MERNYGAMRSEDFWFLARLWRGSRPAAACDRAKTQPKPDQECLLFSVHYGNMPQMSIESLRLLPRSEKLKLMEALWEELSRPDHEFESPAWHATELAATERRLAKGQEQALDWEQAKLALRNKFR